MQPAHRNLRPLEVTLLALLLVVLWQDPAFGAEAVDSPKPPVSASQGTSTEPAVGDKDLDTPELPKLPSAWVKSFDVRAWTGYKDNVLMGNDNLEASPFVAGGYDLSLYRLLAVITGSCRPRLQDMAPILERWHDALDEASPK